MSSPSFHQLNICRPTLISPNLLAYRFLYDLYGKGNTTRKQIQEAVEAASALVSSHVAVIENEVSTLLASHPQLAQSNPHGVSRLLKTVSAAQDTFKGLSTDHQRMVEFKQQGLIMPQVSTLGTRKEVLHGETVEMDATAHYVSIVDTLSAVYSRPAETPRVQTGDTIISDYANRDNSELSLILYNDDIELANPLGSRAGVHKLLMFYMSVHGTPASKLCDIHLVLTCYSTDVKQHGLDKILAPLIADLERLKDGVPVYVGGRVRTLRARLTHLVADNLAANQTLGMVCSFTNCQYCRFCISLPARSKRAVTADETELRCEATHTEDVRQALAANSLIPNPEQHININGVKKAAALDSLSYFSSIEATVPDVMHDILEGVGKRELALILQDLVARRVITLADVNRGIIHYSYG